MHTNHRRKNKFRTKHHGRRSLGWMAIYSRSPMRRESWQKRRAQAQYLMAHEAYDDLPRRYPKTIDWDYW